MHAVIGWMALAAYAEPPRGEVVLGWAGNADHGYGFLSVSTALVRGEDARSSLVLKATVSELYYTWIDAGLLNEVDSPGASIGPGFTYTTEHFGLGAAIGFEARRDSYRIDLGPPARSLELDASLSGNLGWRPGAGTALYALTTFSAVNQNLWARVGAVQQVIPLVARGTKVSLWLGPEATTIGGRETRLLELGGVAEVPVPKIHAAFSVRAGVSMQERGGENVRQGTAGAGVYWSY